MVYRIREVNFKFVISVHVIGYTVNKEPKELTKLYLLLRVKGRQASLITCMFFVDNVAKEIFGNICEISLCLWRDLSMCDGAVCEEVQ